VRCIIDKADRGPWWSKAASVHPYPLKFSGASTINKDFVHLPQERFKLVEFLSKCIYNYMGLRPHPGLNFQFPDRISLA